MNSFELIPNNLIDVDLVSPSGYDEEVARGDNLSSLRDAAGDTLTEFPDHLWIDPDDWDDWCVQNDENNTWPINYVDRFTNQSPTHECTCHALSRIFEGSRNRARGMILGPPVAGKRLDVSARSSSVWVSPLSVYAEANPRQWGGASTRGVLYIAQRRGMLPEKIQPRDYRLKHTLIGTCGKGGINQSKGSWVSLKNFPDGWQETAKHFRPLEIIIPESWEQIVCLVLHGLLVGGGREGHAIPYAIWNNRQRVMGYVDSYDVVRYDSASRLKKAVGSSYAIASTTVPDNWDYPAGA